MGEEKRCLHKLQHLRGYMNNEPNNQIQMTCKRSHLTDDIYECISEDAYICSYALRFGNGFYCRHTECPASKEQKRKGDKVFCYASF